MHTETIAPRRRGVTDPEVRQKTADAMMKSVEGQKDLIRALLALPHSFERLIESRRRKAAATLRDGSGGAQSLGKERRVRELREPHFMLIETLLDQIGETMSQPNIERREKVVTAAVDELFRRFDFMVLLETVSFVEPLPARASREAAERVAAARRRVEEQRTEVMGLNFGMVVNFVNERRRKGEIPQGVEVADVQGTLVPALADAHDKWHHEGGGAFSTWATLQLRDHWSYHSETVGTIKTPRNAFTFSSKLNRYFNSCESPEQARADLGTLSNIVRQSRRRDGNATRIGTVIGAAAAHYLRTEERCEVRSAALAPVVRDVDLAAADRPDYAFFSFVLGQAIAPARNASERTAQLRKLAPKVLATIATTSKKARLECAEDIASLIEDDAAQDWAPEDRTFVAFFPEVLEAVRLAQEAGQGRDAPAEYEHLEPLMPVYCGACKALSTKTAIWDPRTPTTAERLSKVLEIPQFKISVSQQECGDGSSSEERAERRRLEDEIFSNCDGGDEIISAAHRGEVVEAIHQEMERLRPHEELALLLTQRGSDIRAAAARFHGFVTATLSQQMRRAAELHLASNAEFAVSKIEVFTQ